MHRHKNYPHQPLCNIRGTRKSTYTTFLQIKQYKICRIENFANEGDLGLVEMRIKTLLTGYSRKHFSRSGTKQT